MSECAARRAVNPLDGVTASAVVDHVRPHGGDRARFWDELGNWQALCVRCHNRKTRRGL